MIVAQRSMQYARDDQPGGVAAKSHIIHMGAHEHHPISSSLKHIHLLS